MQFYTVLGISKQAFHDRLNNLLQRNEEKGLSHMLIRNLREDHPRMSTRMMYGILRPETPSGLLKIKALIDKKKEPNKENPTQQNTT